MANVGDVVVGLRADLSGYTTAMRTAGQTAVQTGNAIGSGLSQSAALGTRGVGRLENAVTNLGLGLAGLGGPLGNVLDKMGGFFIGGAITAGASIGIGLLVNHLTKLGDAAEDTAAKVQRAADAVVRLRETEREEAARRLAELRTLRAELLKQLDTPGGPYGEGVGERVRERLNRFQAGLRAVGDVRKDLADVNAEIVRLTASVIEMDEKSRKPLEDQTKAWSKLSGEMIRAQQTAVEAAAVPAFLLGQQAAPQTDMSDAGYTTEPYDPSRTPRILLGAREREQIAQQVEEDRPQWQGVGQQIGDIVGEGLARGIASSIVRGADDLGDVLKNVFLEIMETILIEVIRPFAKRIGQAISGALSGGGGGGLEAAVIGGAISIVGGLFGFSRAATQPTGGGTVIVPTSAIPPNPNPLAVARDAQWQALFGETARVAERSGVRLVFA